MEEAVQEAESADVARITEAAAVVDSEIEALSKRIQTVFQRSLACSKELERNKKQLTKVQSAARNAIDGLRSRAETLRASVEEAELASPEGVRSTCIVCTERDIQVASCSCGHACTCVECAEQLVRQHGMVGSRCPVCKSVFMPVMRIFLP